MSSETRVPPTEITGLYGGLMKAAMRKMLGGVPVGVEVMWHHRAVLGPSDAGVDDHHRHRRKPRADHGALHDDRVPGSRRRTGDDRRAPPGWHRRHQR